MKPSFSFRNTILLFWCNFLKKTLLSFQWYHTFVWCDFKKENSLFISGMPYLCRSVTVAPVSWLALLCFLLLASWLRIATGVLTMLPLVVCTHFSYYYCFHLLGLQGWHTIFFLSKTNMLFQLRTKTHQHRIACFGKITQNRASSIKLFIKQQLNMC